MFVFDRKTEELSLTLLETNLVSPRGNQLKNPLLHRRYAWLEFWPTVYDPTKNSLKLSLDEK